MLQSPTKATRYVMDLPAVAVKCRKEGRALHLELDATNPPLQSALVSHAVLYDIKGRPWQIGFDRIRIMPGLSFTIDMDEFTLAHIDYAELREAPPLPDITPVW